MGHTVGSDTYRTESVDADTFYQQGESLANLGHYPEALEAFDRAIAAHPPRDTKLAATWVFRAVVLIHLQSYDEALVSCDRALAVEPRNVEAWVFRGVALNYLENYPDSYASYAKAMKLAQPQTTSHGYSVSSREQSRDAFSRFPTSHSILVSHPHWKADIRSKLLDLWHRLKRLRFRH